MKFMHDVRRRWNGSQTRLHMNLIRLHRRHVFPQRGEHVSGYRHRQSQQYQAEKTIFLAA